MIDKMSKNFHHLIQKRKFLLKEFSLLISVELELKFNQKFYKIV